MILVFPFARYAHINGVASLALTLSSFLCAQNQFEFVVCSLLFERQSKVNRVVVGLCDACARWAGCASSRNDFKCSPEHKFIVGCCLVQPQDAYFIEMHKITLSFADKR